MIKKPKKAESSQCIGTQIFVSSATKTIADSNDVIYCRHCCNNMGEVLFLNIR